jgi:sialate O-acetylesterase
MPTRKSFLSILFCAVALISSASADVSLPSLLADHMVIQRGQPVHVWGKAAPGEAVSVTLGGDTISPTADSLGFWSVYLPPRDAGGPFELTVKGNNTITLRDVLAGDVWVASGQSNMEWPVSASANAASEIAAATHPRIRLYRVKKNVATYPLLDAEADPWTPCTPETVRDFSAVAYFFGRHLQEKLGVPIGLIESAWGGTPADAWTSLRSISADASLMPVFAEWSRMTDDFAVSGLRRERQLEEWRQAVEKAKAAGKEPPGFPWEPNERGCWAPAGLFNAMIAPLTRYPIRGAIWYQGESNAPASRAPLYARLFQTMIQDWRRAWGQSDFPFLFVQLANFRPAPDMKWPEVREAQRQALTLVKTGMAVTIDIGDPADIHPKNKQDVGARLALAARAIEYGERIEHSGPLFRQATREEKAIRVWFDHAAGLTAKGRSVRGFEIAGADRKFVPAEARIDGATIIVSSSSVSEPRHVRYGWAGNPECDLYNAERLPASPFRSEE